MDLSLPFLASSDTTKPGVLPLAQSFSLGASEDETVSDDEGPLALQILYCLAGVSPAPKKRAGRAPFHHALAARLIPWLLFLVQLFWAIFTAMAASDSSQLPATRVQEVSAMMIYTGQICIAISLYYTRESFSREINGTPTWHTRRQRNHNNSEILAEAHQALLATPAEILSEASVEGVSRYSKHTAAVSVFVGAIQLIWLLSPMTQTHLEIRNITGWRWIGGLLGFLGTVSVFASHMVLLVRSAHLNRGISEAFGYRLRKQARECQDEEEGKRLHRQLIEANQKIVLQSFNAYLKAPMILAYVFGLLVIFLSSVSSILFLFLDRGAQNPISLTSDIFFICLTLAGLAFPLYELTKVAQRFEAVRDELYHNTQLQSQDLLRLLTVFDKVAPKISLYGIEVTVTSVWSIIIVPAVFPVIMNLSGISRFY